MVQLEGHTSSVKSLDYHPSGDYLISSDIQGNIKIWDVSPDASLPKCIKTLSGVSYTSETDSTLQSTVAWKPDGSCFAFPGTGNEIRIFQSSGAWSPMFDLSGDQHTSHVITFSWSPNGLYLASSAEDNSFVIWNVKTKKPVVSEVSSAQISGIAWNPKENELTLTDVHGQVRVWKEVMPASLPHPATIERNKQPLNASQKVLRQEIKQEIKKEKTQPPKKAPAPKLESLFDSAAEDDDEEGEDIDMLEELGEDVDEVDDDEGEDLGDFVIDDDGAGYVETEKPSYQQRPNPSINLGPSTTAVAKRQRQLEAAFEPPMTFQPGETPYHKPEPGKSFEPVQGERRYMAYNLVGAISTIYEEDHSVINVEFHDQTEHRNFHFTDVQNFTMGAIGVIGTVFAVEGKDTVRKNAKVKKEFLDDDDLSDDDDITSTHINSSLYFRPNKLGSNNKDWTHHMLPGEDVVSVAINRVSVITTTSLGLVRIFTISGVQKYVFSLENVVSMAAMTDLAFIVYSPGPAFKNQQNLEYTLLNTDTNEVLQKDKVQLSTDSTLNWIGFSETNQVVTYDSAGVLRVLNRQRRPFQASWVPVFDSKLHAEKVQRPNEKYWPVGVLRDRLMCIVLRGNMDYPFFPRPPIKDVPLQLPLLEQTTEVGRLEEQVLRTHTTALHERDEAEATGEEHDYALAFADADMQMDIALLKLINLAVKSDQLSRAIDLTYSLHSEESMEKAIKIANFHRYSGLAERMRSIKEVSHIDIHGVFCVNVHCLLLGAILER